MPTPQINLVPTIPDVKPRTDFSAHFLNSGEPMITQIITNNEASRNLKCSDCIF